MDRQVDRRRDDQLETFRVPEPNQSDLPLSTASIAIDLPSSAASIAIDLPSSAVDALVATHSGEKRTPFAPVDGLGIVRARTAMNVCMGVSTISLTSRTAAPPPMATSRQPPQASMRTSALV